MGFLLISFSLIFSMISIIFILLKKSYFFKVFSLLSLLSLISSLFYLSFLFFSNSFSFYYIYSHSSSDLEFIYKLSALWAGQQGSLLLWASISQTVSFIYICCGKDKDLPEIIILSFNNIFFNILLITFSYPFSVINTSTIINEGSGLNPILKNPYMAIHPPVTFIAYAIGLILFARSFSNAYTAQNKIDDTRRINLLFAFLLGIGLSLGSVWSYSTLGWGGFWGWDPVENSSFIPWLLSIGVLHLIHAFKISKSQRLFKIINIISMLIYISIIYSSYLTRSGVLIDTSVHSFSSDGTGGPFLIYLIILLLSLITVSTVQRTNTNKHQNSNLNFKYDILLYSSTIILLFSFILFFLISAPAAGKLFGINFITERELYIRTASLTAVLFSAFYITYELYYLRIKLSHKSIIVILSIFFSAIIVFLTKPDLISSIILIFAIPALLFSIYRISILIYKNNFTNTVFFSKILHCILFIFIIAAALINITGEAKPMLLEENSPSIIENRAITFQGYNAENSTINIKINKEDHIVKYIVNKKGVTTFPVIVRSFLSDLYIEPVQRIKGEDQAKYLQLSKEPISWFEDNTIKASLTKLDINKTESITVNAEIEFIKNNQKRVAKTSIKFIDNNAVIKDSENPFNTDVFKLHKFSPKHNIVIIERTVNPQSKIPNDLLEIKIIKKYFPSFIIFSFIAFSLALLFIIFRIRHDRN